MDGSLDGSTEGYAGRIEVFEGSPERTSTSIIRAAPIIMVLVSRLALLKDREVMSRDANRTVMSGGSEANTS
ncbi:hypothetical protein D6850_18200 [Roseovarius spongiae]|uniref:Uncharacterized protein n=1 Tax=Roseovarius spongiae TaxID=2320272 RepID=A0A3A8B3N6_9RHOB|nr:hypothetical protein [Roseovarius spongiae]RKF12404.1 hypothetical protein D6850_18200 [Roseovarius spongiae]